MADVQVDYRVAAIDLRGWNLSDKPVDPQAYETSQLVGDVRAVIEHEDAAYAVHHYQAMAKSFLDAMFNYYRINWPTEPYAARSDTPPLIQAPTLLIRGLEDPCALASGLTLRNSGGSQAHGSCWRCPALQVPATAGLNLLGLAPATFLINRRSAVAS